MSRLPWKKAAKKCRADNVALRKALEACQYASDYECPLCGDGGHKPDCLIANALHLEYAPPPLPPPPPDYSQLKPYSPSEEFRVYKWNPGKLDFDIINRGKSSFEAEDIVPLDIKFCAAATVTCTPQPGRRAGVVMIDDPIKEAANMEQRKFPPGPWDGEPDLVEWQTEAGYPAAIVRNPIVGHLNGYVCVSSGHPLYGKDETSVEGIEVHGGLTYAARYRGYCSTVEELATVSVGWWFGFDCCHWDDMGPAFRGRLGEYRDIGFVRRECESLASQLAAIARGAK